MKNWRKLDKAYESEKQRYPHPVPSRAFILETIINQEKPLTYSALAKLFDLNEDEKEILEHRLKAMVRDEQLEKGTNGKFHIAVVRPALIGKVLAHPEGFGFFIPDDKTLTNGEDLFLHYSEMRSVMHGDRIEAQEMKSQRKGKLEGKVVRIIEHANKTIIGRLVDDNGKKVIKAENRRISQKIIATNLADIDVEDNHVVEVKITTYPRNEKPILGEIIQILGDKADNGMEIDIAISSHDLPHEWSEELVAQTTAISDEVMASDYEGREDLRHLPLVTIDGITARDFDDAVFARKTKLGYKLFVAIADVAHYVQKDSPLDVEAVNRATSVYFPNRVIPMLPEKLSNGLCSLNPHVDRLCMVCEMVIDATGKITRSRFYDAVMNSHARLTYETVESVLFSKKPHIPEEVTPLLPHLQTLKSLYELLRGQRDERGALDFRTVEPEFEYDADGKIAHIVASKSLKSHQLIEEFMVRANVCAASFLLKQKGKQKPVALFRNHLCPSEDKYDALVTALAQEGVKVAKCEGDVTPQFFSEIIKKIKDKENFESLQLMILRSMYQAVYEPVNHGHFGLALENYAHFTSPIRRYPDLLVHRAIKHAVYRKQEPYIYSDVQMQALGEQCSMAERRADDAVYDVIGFLKCEYMQDKLGQVFGATISAVTNFGFFTSLDGEFMDGLVHISSLDGDYFQFDDERRILIGERSRKVYKVGDKIDIIVSAVRIDERRIDFVLTEEFLPFNGKGSKSKSAPKSAKPKTIAPKKSVTRKKKPRKKGK